MKTGNPFPLGASVTATGVNFGVFSYHASRAELLLFDAEDATQPSRIIDLDPETCCTSHYWHVHLPGIKAGQLYGYRMSGHYAPELGHRFDPEKTLIEPYARAISLRNYQRDDLPVRRPGQTGRSGELLGLYPDVLFCPPHGGYSSRGDPLGYLDEFRDMVKALHKAGIEVILDVVYNHTAEGGAGGRRSHLKS